MIKYFHIIQHGNGNDNLFVDPQNYDFFLTKAAKFLLPKVTILAYCLLPNHLHLLIKIIDDSNVGFQAISNLFNSYAKSYNKVYNRRGSLFIKGMKKIVLPSATDVKRTILYIHRNPIHHHFTSKYEAYKYSSYNEILKGHSDIIAMDEVLKIFAGQEDFIKSHENYLYFKYEE